MNIIVNFSFLKHPAQLSFDKFTNISSYENKVDVLVLHTPIIKYIFEIYLGMICIAGVKNGKENMEGLKTVQFSTIVVTLLYSTYLA